MDVVERFAARVREERRRLGVSQERLADMAGLHRTYLSNLERAQINATLRTAEAVAGALGMELVDLLGPSGGSAGEDGVVSKARGRYAGVPTGPDAGPSVGMRLRITLETDERGELKGSGRARFGERVFPFRVDDVRAAEDGGESTPQD